jgi:hypothetical protein
MEFKIESNEEIIKLLLDDQNTENNILVNLEDILKVIDTIENLTSSKLYNKDKIIEELVELSNDNIYLTAKKLIKKYLIPQIKFDTIFRSNLDFTLIFRNEQVVVFYKNKQVNSLKLLEIKNDLIQNKLNHLSIIVDIYVNNIINIIEKFINLDITVKYYCTEIPKPYLKLFEIKCNKYNSNNLMIAQNCKDLENIIFGNDYLKQEQTGELNIISLTSYDSSDLERKELDEYYRSEVILCLTNNNDFNNFLYAMKQIDALDENLQLNSNSYIINYIKTLLNASFIMHSNFAKFYYIYKIYDFIIKVPQFIKSNDKFKKMLSNKILEFNERIYILESSGLKFYKAYKTTIDKAQILLNSITVNETNNSINELFEENEL